MHAGMRTNACFWLSFAAGWTRCVFDDEYFDANPFLKSLRHLYQQVRDTPIEQLGARQNRRDPVGDLADRFRQYFCGNDGLLFSREGLRKWAPAYAALTPGSSASIQDYKRWVARVAKHEFADEIILAAVAQHVRVWIVVIPFTPPTVQTEWRIVDHPDEDLRNAFSIAGGQRLVLGNNDVHYVWLPRGDS